MTYFIRLYASWVDASWWQFHYLQGFNAVVVVQNLLTLLKVFPKRVAIAQLSKVHPLSLSNQYDILQMSKSQETQSPENLSWTNILNFLKALKMKRIKMSTLPVKVKVCKVNIKQPSQIVKILDRIHLGLVIFLCDLKKLLSISPSTKRW